MVRGGLDRGVCGLVEVWVEVWVWVKVWMGRAFGWWRVSE